MPVVGEAKHLQLAAVQQLSVATPVTVFSNPFVLQRTGKTSDTPAGAKWIDCRGTLSCSHRDADTDGDRYSTLRRTRIRVPGGDRGGCSPGEPIYRGNGRTERACLDLGIRHSGL
jgi:hypothetical protein